MKRGHNPRTASRAGVTLFGAHGRAQAAKAPPDAEIHVEFEVRGAEGAEAERLRLEQASVLKEVTEWLAARRQSEPGRDRAA